MRLPDVNVLVAALRPDAEHHDRCRDWLDSAFADSRPVAMTGAVISGTVRVLTHPKIFAPPSRIVDVVSELSRLLTAPGLVRIEPGARHWTIFDEIVREADARGNLIPDAWLAAIAIEHGCTMVTLDGDFKRFDALDVQRP